MNADDFKFIFFDLQVKEYEVEVAVISERWVLEQDLACYPPMLRTPVCGKNDEITCQSRGTLRNLVYISHANQKDLQ